MWHQGKHLVESIAERLYYYLELTNTVKHILIFIALYAIYSIVFVEIYFVTLCGIYSTTFMGIRFMHVALCAIYSTTFVGPYFVALCANS